jgi:hypothetical protein
LNSDKVKINGSFDAVSANPIKNFAWQIPWYVVFRKIISNKARNGSIETLMEASIIRAFQLQTIKRRMGIINNAAEAKIAPAKSKVSSS